MVLEKRGPPTLRRDQTSEAQLFCFQIVSLYPLARQKSPWFSMVKFILRKHLSRFRFALVLISWIFSLECLGSRRVTPSRISHNSLPRRREGEAARSAVKPSEQSGWLREKKINFRIEGRPTNLTQFLEDVSKAGSSPLFLRRDIVFDTSFLLSNFPTITRYQVSRGDTFRGRISIFFPFNTGSSL